MNAPTLTRKLASATLLCLFSAPREGKSGVDANALPPHYKKPAHFCSAPAERSGDGALYGDHNRIDVLEIIRHLQFIGFETIDGFYLSSGSGAFKPRHRTPRVMSRNWDEAMLYRILVSII